LCSQNLDFTNQDKLLKALIPLGFKAFYLEDLPFEHQIELFEQARFIVASHGAGLTNIIFAKTSSVVEIFAEQTLPCYFQLAKTLGLSYGFLVCKSKKTGCEGDQKNQNVEVDISQLMQIIQKMYTSIDITNADR
jgi:capsular polysaccharide biosynthesis protein